MGYRKITINKREYQYTTGKTHTKIRLGTKSEIFLNAYIGNPLPDNKFRVSPANIRNAINRQPPPEFECRLHGVKTTRLVYNPYRLEIRGKKMHMIDCPECYRASAEDI